MKKLYLLLLILALSGVTWLLGWGCGSGLAEDSKKWILEDEFTADGKLRATPKHTVVLQLEQGASKVHNSIPYVFEERAKYNFCIDEEDPLIDSMKLVNAEGRTVLSVNKKKRCVTKTIGKGRYRMHVYHDGKAVGDSLQYAFVHQKKAPLPLGKNNPWAGPSPADAQKGEEPLRSSKAGAVGDPPPFSGYWTIEASNGKAIRSPVMQRGYDSPLFADGNKDIPILRFSFHQPGRLDSTFGCKDRDHYASDCSFDIGWEYHLLAKFSDSGEDCSWGNPNCFYYGLSDLGNYQFRIYYQKFLEEGRWPWNSDNGFAFLLDDGSLSTVPACAGSVDPSACVFTLAAINDVPAAQVPAGSLQKGQVALYNQPDCSGTATVVMPGNHELDEGFVSVRLPHDTRITLYQGGEPVVMKERQRLTAPECINLKTDPKHPLFQADSITVEYTPDILISTKKCRYCDLYGLSLQNMTLDGFDFSYAYLANTHFNSSSMKGVNLSHAVLAGAQLDQANLQGSNMCNAFLQGNVEIPTAASLNGAYMKNVNLSGANLSGVSMINTDFYNTGALPCQASCDSNQMASTCATAVYATMDGTQATPAYLARTDFSGIKTTGANFSGSILVGANFSNAQLHTDTSSTARTNFAHAFLQGADFSGASVDYASFSGAYVDLTPQTHLGFQIPWPYTHFNGFWSTSGSSICVDNLNPVPTVVPATNSSNICPDGSPGPCSTDAWTYFSTKLDQADPKAGYGLCPCDVFGYCGDKKWSE